VQWNQIEARVTQGPRISQFAWVKWVRNSSYSLRLYITNGQLLSSCFQEISATFLSEFTDRCLTSACLNSYVLRCVHWGLSVIIYFGFKWVSTYLNLKMFHKAPNFVQVFLCSLTRFYNSNASHVSSYFSRTVLFIIATSHINIVYSLNFCLLIYPPKCCYSAKIFY
jgi:hypothetical protein